MCAGRTFKYELRRHNVLHAEPADSVRKVLRHPVAYPSASIVSNYHERNAGDDESVHRRYEVRGDGALAVREVGPIRGGFFARASVSTLDREQLGLYNNGRMAHPGKSGITTCHRSSTPVLARLATSSYQSVWF